MNWNIVIYLGIASLILSTVYYFLTRPKKEKEVEIGDPTDPTKPKPTIPSTHWSKSLVGVAWGVGIFLIAWFLWAHRFLLMPKDHAERKTSTECYETKKDYYKKVRFEFSGTEYRNIHIGFATFDYYVEGGTLEGRNRDKEKVVLNKADIPLIDANYSSMSLRSRNGETVILIVNYYKLKKEKVKC